MLQTDPCPHPDSQTAGCHHQVLVPHPGQSATHEVHRQGVHEYLQDFHLLHGICWIVLWVANAEDPRPIVLLHPSGEQGEVKKNITGHRNLFLNMCV